MRIHNRKIFATAIGICLFLLVIGETNAVPGNGLPMQSRIVTSSISALSEKAINATPLCDTDNLYPGAPIDFNYLIMNDGTEDVYVSLSLLLEAPASSFFSQGGEVPADWKYDAAEDKYYYSIEGMYEALAEGWIYCADDNRYYYKKVLSPDSALDPANAKQLFVSKEATVDQVLRDPQDPTTYSYTMHIPPEWGIRTMGIEINIVATVTAIQAEHMGQYVQFDSYPYWPV